MALEVEPRKSRHHNTLLVNHITLPSLNEKLVGFNHRLITERSLPGPQTRHAFPQAFSASHRSAGLTDPQLYHRAHCRSFSTHSHSVLDLSQRDKAGEGENPKRSKPSRRVGSSEKGFEWLIFPLYLFKSWGPFFQLNLM